ncbi:restriction endonuclease subunit S [Thermoanaerobacter siderophilus]|uniref:Restriction endonuclease S subunit n=1 Tax=Thermoanaerobacter siderophilus SR4 TaxID=880478 RepID=I9KSM9_9THEO|nr:restriction endonuclease subunit S [Thermoanaerobacter siderophilus]EIV99908.1 restriction endonuclease S subunit [Thermoanaerobacter siderophilus SR4]
MAKAKHINDTVSDLPEGFKMTELGPLPEEWEVVRLGEVIEEVKERNRSNFKYPVFTISNIHGFVLSDVFFDKQVYSKNLSTYKIVRSGYFAYNPYRVNVGSLALFDKEVGLVSPAYIVFKISEPHYLYPIFLYRLLKSPQYLDEIKRISMSRGSVRRSLAFRDLSDFFIPLPPLSEQQTIANILQTVQRAKEATEKVIKAMQELKKSLMRYLFTYGPVSVDEVDKVQLKETEIGLVPGHWEVVKLGEVIQESFSGGTPPTNVREYWDGTIPWTTSAIISEDEVLLSRHQRAITNLGLANSSSKIAPRESVIVGTRVGVGKAVVATFDIAINQDLTALILNKEKIEPLFLVYLFKSTCLQQQIKNRTRGTTIKGITRRDLLNISILLPPLHNQQAIVRILQVVDQKIQAEKAKKQALETLFQALLHHLMTGKLRVKDIIFHEIKEE